LRNRAQVDDDGLDAVSFSFDLGLDSLHLVTIELIVPLLGVDSKKLNHVGGVVLVSA
jgi:hypothetical protein